MEIGSLYTDSNRLEFQHKKEHLDTFEFENEFGVSLESLAVENQTQKDQWKPIFLVFPKTLGVVEEAKVVEEEKGKRLGREEEREGEEEAEWETKVALLQH